MTAKTLTRQRLNRHSVEALRAFFNSHHEKLVCTANGDGEPNVALMGTPRLLADLTVELEISDVVSVTLNNLRENKSLVLIAFIPGQRARDFRGARIYARVDEIVTSGEKIEALRRDISEKHGPEKAAELQATVKGTVTKIRPIVDRGQAWDEAPFGEV
jgi:hypothetical protein